MFTSVSTVVSYLLVPGLLLLIFFLYRNVNAVNSKILRAVCLAAITIYSGLFIFVFPGFVSIDDVYTIEQANLGVASVWQSYSYSVLLFAGYRLTGCFGILTLLSLLIYFIIFIRFVKIIDGSGISEKKKTVFSVLLLLLALHPLNQALLLFQCRDTLFSLIFFYLSLLLLEKNKVTGAGVFLLLALLGDLRPEGKVFLILFPVAYWIAKKCSWKLPLGAMVLLSLLLCSSVTDYAYKVTVYILPLSKIFHDNPNEDRTDIEAVLDVDKLIENYSAYDIESIRHGVFKANPTETRWNLFRERAHALIAKHLQLVFETRVQLMQSLLFFGDPPLIVYDALSVSANSKMGERLSRAQVQGVQRGEYQSTYLQKLSGLQSWLAILAALAALLYCLFIKEFRMMAVMIILRLLLLFAFAPANYVKYAYVLVLFFTFIPVVLGRKKPCL